MGEWGNAGQSLLSTVREIFFSSRQPIFYRLRYGVENKLWACPVFSDSEEGIISGLFGFKVSWGLVVKTGMESGAVVEGFDVMEDGATRFGQGGEALVVNQFVFETAKERFEEPKWGQSRVAHSK